jgi:squalene synthase HpnC
LEDSKVIEVMGLKKLQDLCILKMMKKSAKIGLELQKPFLLAQQHYENFPVGSFFLPLHLRRPIHLIYAYARVADDIADEGVLAEAERIQQLDEWELSLLHAVAGEGADPFFNELAQVISQHSLTLEYFRDLITAFRMDSRSTRYRTFQDLLLYCQYSANPIGRLLLELFRGTSELSLAASDALCTALQLANFWQDLSVDTQRERLYIPLEDLERFGCADMLPGPALRNLVEFQIRRTREIFSSGRSLIALAPRALRFETALTWHGGMRILEKIESQNFDSIQRRTTLTIGDKALVFIRAARSTITDKVTE